MASREPTRTVRITYKDTDEGHAEREHRISMVHNFLKLRNEHDTLFYLLEKGLAEALDEMGRTGDSEAKLAAAIQKKLLDVQRKESQWTSLNKLYDKMSSEEFTAWCAESNIDMDTFLEWREKKAMDSHADMVRKWLSDLLRDGNPVQVDAIKQMAIDNGVVDLDNMEQQWKYIKVIAHREGYTGRIYGCWQRETSSYKPDF